MGFKILVAFLTFVFGWTVYAWAQNTALPIQAPQGTTILTLTASAQQTVAPDTLTARLRYEHTASTSEAVQRVINTKVAAALTRADTLPGVKAVTRHYHVYEQWLDPKHTNEQRRKTWHGQQSLSISGRDFEEIQTLVGEFQADGFLIDGMDFSLSRQIQRDIQAQLEAQALDEIQFRAQKFAQQLKKPQVHFAQIDMQGESPAYPRPFARGGMAMLAMDAAESMPAPSARADDVELSTTISAHVWLQ